MKALQWVRCLSLLLFSLPHGIISDSAMDEIQSLDNDIKMDSINAHSSQQDRSLQTCDPNHSGSEYGDMFYEAELWTSSQMPVNPIIAKWDLVNCRFALAMRHQYVDHYVYVWWDSAYNAYNTKVYRYLYDAKSAMHDGWTYQDKAIFWIRNGNQYAPPENVYYSGYQSGWPQFKISDYETMRSVALEAGQQYVFEHWWDNDEVQEMLNGNMARMLKFADTARIETFKFTYSRLVSRNQVRILDHGYYYINRKFAYHQLGHAYHGNFSYMLDFTEGTNLNSFDTCENHNGTDHYFPSGSKVKLCCGNQCTGDTDEIMKSVLCEKTVSDCYNTLLEDCVESTRACEKVIESPEDLRHPDFPSGRSKLPENNLWKWFCLYDCVGGFTDENLRKADNAQEVSTRVSIPVSGESQGIYKVKYKIRRDDNSVHQNQVIAVLKVYSWYQSRTVDEFHIRKSSLPQGNKWYIIEREVNLYSYDWHDMSFIISSVDEGPEIHIDWIQLEYSHYTPLRRLKDTNFWSDFWSRSYHDCVSAAESYGLEMASIHTYDDRMAVKSFGWYFWLGAERTRKWFFRWTDGTLFNYRFWNSGHPGNERPAGWDARMEFRSNGKIATAHADWTRACLFQKPVSSFTVNDSPFYDLGFTGFVGECGTMGKNNHGLVLASVHSNAESNKVSGLPEPYWLGGSKTPEGVFGSWKTGSPWNYTNWQSGEDFSFGFTELATNGKWISQDHSLDRKCLYRKPELTRIGESEFYAYGGYKLFEDCKSFGIDNNMTIASIHSSEEQDIIAAWVLDHYWSSYVGGYKMNGAWLWNDGTDWDYDFWSSGNPSGDGPHTEVMNSGQGQWNDLSPWHERGCIFKNNPPYLKKMGTSNFYLLQGVHTWNNCKQWAENLNMEFASIHSSVEMDIIDTHLRKNTFIGGYETYEGHWAWTDGTPWDYDGWRNGQPNNYGNRQHHLEILQDSNTWNDIEQWEQKDCVLRKTSEPFNVALRKPTSQSSLDYDGHPSKAVDDNTEGIWSPTKTITCTENEAGPWWKVDLQKNYNIFEIKIYNRIDSCCQYRLDGFILEIFRNEALVFSHTNPTGIPPHETIIEVPNVLGDEVRVSLPQTTVDFLSLAEVVVMGS